MGLIYSIEVAEILFYYVKAIINFYFDNRIGVDYSKRALSL